MFLEIPVCAFHIKVKSWWKQRLSLGWLGSPYLFWRSLAIQNPSTALDWNCSYQSFYWFLPSQASSLPCMHRWLGTCQPNPYCHWAYSSLWGLVPLDFCYTFPLGSPPTFQSPSQDAPDLPVHYLWDCFRVTHGLFTSPCPISQGTSSTSTPSVLMTHKSTSVFQYVSFCPDWSFDLSFWLFLMNVLPAAQI